MHGGARLPDPYTIPTLAPLALHAQDDNRADHKSPVVVAAGFVFSEGMAFQLIILLAESGTVDFRHRNREDG